MSILSHYKGHLSRRIFAALIFDASRIYCNWHQISRGRQGSCPGGRAKLMDPKLDDWCDILGPYIWSYMIIYLYDVDDVYKKDFLYYDFAMV